MVVRLSILVAAFISVGAQQAVPPSLPSGRCLHGASETESERARREQALRVAHQINLAEMSPRLPFRPLDQLVNVPTIPPGFAVNLTTDGRSYVFSLKDERDRCHYSIFSDQDRWVYEATPTQNPVTVPVTH
jgi:hypothetical protein